MLGLGSSTVITLIKAVQLPLALLTALGLGGSLWPEQTTLKNNASYDFIIVGAGSAGCVIARRLVEDTNCTVLLLEAGGDPPIAAMFPGLYSILSGSSVDYNYTSVVDKYAASSQNYYSMLTTGKMLGGSDSMNHLIQTRGNSLDYDSWADTVNDSSWTYENVLPYFKKGESIADVEIMSKYSEYHGTDGPMGNSRQLETDSVADILGAFAEVGNPTVLDLNAVDITGYTQPLYMVADKKRQTPAYSYLNPVKDNPNLYVSKDTRVTKIIFENNVAVAVKAVHKGEIFTMRANKEIILCAGVFNSPQLLMLSGIGPKEHLETLNIDVISDLPMGDNFIDQVGVTLVHKVKKYLLPVPNPTALVINPTEIPFPMLVGSVALNKSQTIPDYQTFILKFAHDTPFLTLACAVVFGLRNEICDKLQTQVESWDSLYTVLVNLNPKSRGTIRLKSTDPFEDPLITTGYFNEAEDLENMLEYVKDFINVTNSKYFQENGAEVVGLDLEECADKEKDSDEFWRCYILNRAHSPYHYTGTCPMGTVLDSKFKVKGLERLRVVDASIIPTSLHGAPNAAVNMVAEKASDMIKSDNSL